MYDYYDETERKLQYRYYADTCRSADSDPQYDSWIRRHRSNESQLEQQRSHVFRTQPKFSLVVPLYKTPSDLFEAMVDSVKKQTYENWELILVNASPEDERLVELVRNETVNDERVVEITLKGNGGITLNTNEGMRRATGDYVCFFDHDDVLEPDILFEYARAIEDDPSIDMLYCDEDHLTPEGDYVMGFFKPDFDIDLVRCVNYVCHMLTVRSSFLQQLPEPGREFDGSQDHNMVLKVAERTSHIHHVARILYHWRITPGSVAEDLNNKPYAFDAGLLSVRQHLERLGISARVALDGPGFYRIDYDVIGDPVISVVTAVHKGNNGCLSLLNTLNEAAVLYRRKVELILVGADELLRDVVRTAQERRLDAIDIEVLCWPKLQPSVSSMLNEAVGLSRGEYLLFLDEDAQAVSPEWLEVLIGNCQRPEVGAVGARLYDVDDVLQHAGLVVTASATGVALGSGMPSYSHGYYGLIARQRAASAVSGACLMTRRTVFDEVGGFDDSFTAAYGDVDYCLKQRQFGRIVVYTPYAELRIARWIENDCDDSVWRTHQFENYAALQDKWAELLVDGDPYFNHALIQHDPFCRYFCLDTRL